MPEVKVSLGERSYDILIESGMVDNVGALISRLGNYPRIAIVAQRQVWKLWGKRLIRSMESAALRFTVHLVPNGEAAKTLSWMRRLYREFASAGIDRSSLVVAVGGGAVGDLAGFAAATWLRGVDFVQVPTTLLAQVDASVGGKVAVNLPAGKNLVGAFWQPRAVLIDPQTLQTLSARDVRSGLAEVIKYGIILDKEFFEFCRANQDSLQSLKVDAINHAIARSCELKAFVVQTDERESGLRAILNFGHTIGHAIEAVGKYSAAKHGEVVAIGMVLAASLSVEVGWLAKRDAQIIANTLEGFGLPTRVPRDLAVDDLLDSIALDKKTKDGCARFILAHSIGSVELTDSVATEMVRSAIVRSQGNVAS